MNKLCIVTAASNNGEYLQLCVDLLNSLSKTKKYKNFPVYIIDCGLQKKDKEYIYKTFKSVKSIKDPGWDIDKELIKKTAGDKIFLNWNQNSFKNITARPFLDKHFPGYDYYFWLDSDVWVQDEEGLDQFVKMAEKNGIAMAPDADLFSIWPSKNNYFWLRKLLHSKLTVFGTMLPNSWLTKISGKRVLINSVYCIKKQVSEQYAHNIKEYVKQTRCYQFGSELAVLNYTYYQITEDFIEDDNVNYTDYGCGMPLVDENNKLYSPKNNELIMLLHLAGPYKTLKKNLFMLKHDPNKPVSLLKNFLTNINYFMPRFLAKKYFSKYHTLRYPN